MKNRVTAAILALFLGWAGIHRFYLRQPGYAIFYILLMGFGISFVLGLIDALFFFLMSDEQFDLKYNGGETYPSTIRQRHRVRKGPYAKRQSPRPGRKPVLRRNPFKKEGIEKFREFDYEGAIDEFKKGLDISPNDPALHFNIACAYSLTEKKDEAFEHLDLAVQNGFKDFDKIRTHDALAFIRVQPEYENFVNDGFRINEPKKLEEPKQDILQDDLLLSQLKKLNDLREKGLISEKEFLEEKAKIERT